MTNPTYEINYEKLSDLSISDLESLLTLWKNYYGNHPVIDKEIKKELDKRVNDIIIF